MSLMWQKSIYSYTVCVSKSTQGSECTDQGECGQEAVPREESSRGNALVHFYLKANECEKRKQGAHITETHGKNLCR